MGHAFLRLLIEDLLICFQVDLILKHKISVFINRQLIYNYPEQLFSDAGVMAIEHADFEGIERLALVTGELTRFLFVLCF